ncbi:MAG: TIM barrel protein [Bacteroidota bacterium]
MRVDRNQIEDLNRKGLAKHEKNLAHLTAELEDRGVDVDDIVLTLSSFQVAVPSWALGTGGTRFGRFAGEGEPGSLEDKIEDVGVIHALNQSSGAISLHIPWDIPEDTEAVKSLAQSLGLAFDAVNSNTFQDQEDQIHSYKFGSLCHVDKAVRAQAVAHNCEVIDYGNQLGSKALTVWLADGSSFPGQHSFKQAFQHTLSSLEEIYEHLPSDWTMFIEYKPYEPNFYSMVIPDWGTSHLLATKLGEKAKCLVDLGHHLPNTNIEQIVAVLMMEGRLGGFHFNDSKYGDDDLTVGGLKPYQLFLIFSELVDGMNNASGNPQPSWMIDASHNLKDPIEDLLQSVEAINIAYAQALIIDRIGLQEAQAESDITKAQEILQEAFRTDLRPLVAEARRKLGGALNPITAFRDLAVRKTLVDQRGNKVISTGL